MFAPTNAAFEALPEGVLDALLADTEALTGVLPYHVVAGELTAEHMRQRERFDRIVGRPSGGDDNDGEGSGPP